MPLLAAPAALLAQDDWRLFFDGLMVVLGSSVPVIAYWAIKLFQARFESRRAARADALAEWQTIVDRQQVEIVAIHATAAKQEERIFSLIENVRACERLHAVAREANVRHEAVIQALTNDVRRLQLLTHDSPPAVTVPCILTASASDGIIRACGPASGPILGWLPTELIGQPIDVIVPPENREAHHRGVEAIRLRRRQADPGRTIRTMAMKRTGERVAVAINLSSWTTPMGSVMINADIRLDLAPLPVAADPTPAEPEPEPEPEPPAPA